MKGRHSVINFKLKATTACKELRSSLPGKWKSTKPSYGINKKLRWDRKNKLAYCHVPKVRFFQSY